MKKVIRCRQHGEKKIEMTKTNKGKTYLINVCLTCWAENEHKKEMKEFQKELNEYKALSFFSKIFEHQPTAPSVYDIRDKFSDFVKYENKERVSEFKRSLQKKYYKLHAPSDFDFVCKMTGIEFEDYIKELFKRKGYKVTKTPVTGDNGVDLLLSLKKDGKEVRTAVQCKRYNKNVGVSAVQEVFTGMHFYKCKHAIVVTTSMFTSAATKSASQLKVELWDKIKLIEEIDLTFDSSNKITVSWEEFLYMHISTVNEFPNSDYETSK